jgi:hypothetical protein
MEDLQKKIDELEKKINELESRLLIQEVRISTVEIPSPTYVPYPVYIPPVYSPLTPFPYQNPIIWCGTYNPTGIRNCTGTVKS